MRLIDEILTQLVCLVVDDDPDCRDKLTASLKAVGMREVISAGSGSEALNMLKAPPRPIDLVLADVRMPAGNGLQLLQVIRAGQVKSMRMNSTVLLVTAAPTVGLIQTASALDANGFVAKPVDKDKLAPVIMKARRTLFPPNPGKHATVYVPDEL
jgi:DNA-binding NtrC family response regulator